MSNLAKTGVLTSKTFSEVFSNPLDPNFYVEPDGSSWIRIVHHNNPASSLFASTDNFSQYVYKDSNRWFYGTLCYLITNNVYEFMIKQAQTLGGTETKYRWIQTKNPYVAVFGDVDAADVTKITTSGYSDNASYGGIYKYNAHSFFVANNGNNGKWYGAFGSWTAWSGGIPGYAGVAITTGYMDLYLRIDNQTSVNGFNIFNNSINSKRFYEL